MLVRIPTETPRTRCAIEQLLIFAYAPVSTVPSDTSDVASVGVSGLFVAIKKIGRPSHLKFQS
jgi:hypothetical protein